MSGSPFVDYVKVYFRSGAGGNGVVSWRREKFVDQGGPDGGDGGDGGSIILEGDSQLWTLLDLKYRKHIHAEKGKNGEGRNKHGKDGKDEVIKVPLGTIVKNAETGEIIGEVNTQGEKLMLIKGGHGGRGNWHFRSPTNQAPEHSEPGGVSKQLAVILELKVLADVGLVGFPNAGKSTLLSVVTAAKPKIADYPFTTLVPNLGIVKYKNAGSFAIADIPGIIEGAHEGKGLGHTFLRHIERNAVLIIMIPADSENPKNEYNILLNELREYSPHILHKDRVIAITKCDLIDKKERSAIQKKFKDESDSIYFISSPTMEGINELVDRLWTIVSSKRVNVVEKRPFEEEYFES